MTFVGHLGGPWGTMGDFCRSLGGLSLKDRCTASWFCWQKFGGCWLQLLMTQVGLSGLAGCWRAVVGLYCKLVLLAEHWRRLGAAADDSGWPEWAG